LKYSINNLGDSFNASNYGVHSRKFELEILEFFAKLWKIEDYWGYLTNSGTEGNLQSMLVTRENFPDGILYMISLFGIIIMFVNYSQYNGFIAITVILNIIVTLLQLFNQNNNGSILSSYIVSIYSVWLLFSAIKSFESKDSTQNNQQIIVNGIMASVLLIWSTMSTANFTNGKTNEPKKTIQLYDSEIDELENSEEKIDEENDVENYYKFHIIMTIASLYIAMLLTDWGTIDKDTSGWVKIISQWITIALYGWTIIAESVCINRDF